MGRESAYKLEETNNRRSNQELVGTDKDDKNWKGIFIAIFVICLIIGIVVLAIVLLTPKTKKKEHGKPFSFEDYQSGSFQPKSFSLRWLKDAPGKYVYRDSNGSIVLQSVNSTSGRIIVQASTFTDHDFSRWYVSPDAQFVLFAKNITPVYRHSFLADYFVYNVSGSFSEEPVKIDPPEAGLSLQYLGWTPTGHSLTLVAGNDLYYMPLPDVSPKRLSNDGGKVVFNGVPDWVYEEEVLSTNYAHWVSPDTSNVKVCYAQFNDEGVRIFKFPVYGPPEDQYGWEHDIAYPKAGERNPTVKLFVVSPNNMNSCLQLKAPPHVGKEHYLTSVTWMDGERLAVTWINRRQTLGLTVIYDTSALPTSAPSSNPPNNNSTCNPIVLNGTAAMELDMLKNGDGWLNDIHPVFTDKGDKFFMLYPRKDGTHGFYRQIRMFYSTTAGAPTYRMRRKQLRDGPYLTHGNKEVASILGFHTAQEKLYYLGTDGDARHRHLYSMTLPSKGSVTRCISCAARDGKTCKYVSVSLSPDAKHYLLRCLGPDVPTYTLRSTEDENFEMVLENNTALSQKMAEYAMPRVMYKKITVGKGDEATETWLKMRVPPSLDEAEVLQYPVVVDTYQGPDTQRITDTFKIDWGTYLASSHKVIYASADGRGSGGRGNAFRHAVYKQLGVYESEDQLTAGRFLNDLPYVDSDRTAIWGWSYGGFVTSHVIGAGEDVYKCGVAVAPVTDWRYYDTIYTERYMLRPQDNEAGYNKGNVSAKAENFKKSQFFLIHGTADDNVHYQNAAHLAKALTEAEVQFRMMAYTDKNHGLPGKHTRRHLYTAIEDFLQTCFGGFEKKD